MSANCNHECGSCKESCGDRTEKKSFLKDANTLSHIKNVIGIVSGKGGVGKSLVSATLAASLSRKGYKVGILDGDITGPSMPKVFGVTEKATGSETSIFPVATKTGIQMMSINLLLPNDTDPVVWRGPVIAGTIQQFWTDVVWGELDYLLIDMPPGTGDVPLTVFQSIPVDGIVIVTSPQELVGMIVGKAVKMAKMMNVPILGLVENMAYVSCPDCGKEIKIFGESHLTEVGEEYAIETLARLPIKPEVASACDKGKIEEVVIEELEVITEILERM